jgi:hypothetical protein
MRLPAQNLNMTLRKIDMEIGTEMASGKASQLAEARAALAASGKSPRRIGEESRLKVIQWLYRWGYSSSSCIQELLERTAGGYAQKLARQGWIVATKTESGIPASYFTLSERGQQEAERHTDILLQYQEIDPYRVNQQQIRHYLIAQIATINALRNLIVVSYETERMYSKQGDKPGKKRPDFVWKAASGHLIAGEIELSAKWARRLDEFVLAIANALQTTNEKPAQYSRFVIVSDSPAIIERYREAMSPGAKLDIWKKNQRSHWVIDKTIIVPAWLINKVDFQLIER